jgi:hypothetical protein
MKHEKHPEHDPVDIWITRYPGQPATVRIETSWIEKADVLRLIELLAAEVERMTE